MQNIDRLMNELMWRSSDKICPLLGAGPVEINSNCKGYRCAWWNPHYGACSIQCAYLTMDYVGHQIAQLSDRLCPPTEKM